MKSLKLRRELKVGLIAFLTLALLYWGSNFVKGRSVFEKERIYFAVYDHIDGLIRSAPVKINGFKVGTVEDIYFHPDGSGNLVIRMNINNDFVIPKNTLARIFNADLLGGKSVELELGNDINPAVSGDTLVSDIQMTLSQAVNQQVAPLKAKAESMISSIDTVLTLVQEFLNDDTRNTFMQTFASIKRSFEMLENTVKVVNSSVTKTQGDFESIMANIASISRNLKNNGENLDSIFANVNSISDSLSKIEFVQTFESLKTTISSTEEIVHKINSGEGTLGLLVNNEQLYNDLDETVQQLNKLILDLKYNPNRYLNFSLFGNSRTYSEKEIEEMEKENKKEKE